MTHPLSFARQSGASALGVLAVVVVLPWILPIRACAESIGRQSFSSGGFLVAGSIRLFTSVGQPMAGSFQRESIALNSGFLGHASGRVNLLINGGFEQPFRQGDGVSYSTDPGFNLPGWTYPRGGNEFFLEFGNPFGIARFASGRQAVAINSDGRGSTLSQTLRTVPGAQYQLQFAWAEELPNRPSPARLQIEVGSLSTNLLLGERPGFAQETFTFVARSNRTELRFIDATPSSHPVNSPFLDDVWVTGPPSLEQPQNPVDHLRRWFYARGGDLDYRVYSAAADGSDEQFVTLGRQCRLSPDGRWLVVERDATVQGRGGDLWLRNMVLGEETLLVPNDDWIVGFDWFPDSKEIVYDFAGSIHRLQIESLRTQVTRLGSDGFDDAPTVNPKTPNHFIWHNLNRGIGLGIIFAGSEVEGRSEFFPETPKANAYPSWERNGRDFCYTDGQNLYVAPYPYDPRSVRKLTQLSGLDRLPVTPRFRPDGRAVYAVGSVGGITGIYEVATAGSSPIRVPLPDGAPIAWIGHVPITLGAAPPMPRVSLRGLQGDLQGTIVRLALPLDDSSILETIPALDGASSDWRPLPEVSTIENGERVWDIVVTTDVPMRFFRVRSGN